MLKIRMRRVGRKHEPVFRLILVDSRRGSKTGKSLEILGSYDSRRGEKAEINVERITHWLKHGVQLSPTVHNILVDRGALQSKKINVIPKKILEAAHKPKEEFVQEKKEEVATTEA